MSRTRVPGSARHVLARSAIAVLAVGLTAGMTGAGWASAQPVSPDKLAEAAPAISSSIAADAVIGKISERLGRANGPVTAFVELAEQPAVDAYNATVSGRGKDAAKKAARDAKGRTDRKATAVLGSLRAKDRGTRELYRTNNAVPGVAVVADAAKLRELAASPDVRSIKVMTPKRFDNSNAAQLTNVLASWQQHGLLGDDVRVGIIDTGIDYTHANFGGPGTREAYEAIDETVVDPSYFPTAKVVGGYDFVGNAYDGDDPDNNTPIPDPNPLDCNGHGSHVAGTSSGFGVEADGSTFDGDYSALDGDALDAMRIGPGMAPKSLLYALKVFGCDGSTYVVSLAMDWALDPDQDGDFSDRLDVVNMSLGSEYGAPDDPESLFVRKLVDNGVLAVFSAGNGGDLYDVGGSPGNTPEALTVASVRDSYILRDAAEVVAPAGLAGLKPGQYSVNLDYTGVDVTAPVVKMSDPANLDGCLPFNAADDAAVDGKIVWLEWDDNDATRRCGSTARTNNATAAGAAGSLFTSTLEHFAAGIAGNAVIPVLQLTGSATNELRPALDAGTLVVRLAGELRTALPTYDDGISDTPSSFTSRSVRSPGVKPDVAAPGDTIVSTDVGTGNGAFVNSGTSMAAPHVAGISALVRQAHPDWTPAEVKAAVMNTANHDVYSQEDQGLPITAPNRTGTGRVDAKAALDNKVLAAVEEHPGVVSVGFGVVEAAGPVRLNKTIRLVNKGTSRVTFDVAYQELTSIPGVRYELDRTTVTLNPRGIARVRVSLVIDNPAELRKTADPTIVKEQLGVARQFLADASGRVLFTPTSGSTVPLRVAVHSNPKPVADIDVPNRVRFARNSDQAVLNLTGRGLDQGTGDQRYRSLISIVELQGESPRLRNCGNGVTENCAINETAKGGDLRYVGATSTAPLANAQGNPEESLLAFGIATWSNWYNIGNNTVPFVSIDTDSDGTADFETFVTKPVDTDVLVAATTNLATGATVDLQPVNGLFGDVDSNVFDTNVIVLPVLLTALGLDPTADSHRLTYQVGVSGFYAASNGLVDFIPGTMSFDPLRPGLWVQGGGDAALGFFARPGTALVVNRDAEALEQDGTNRLLALHHHNASGDRTSVVRVTGPAPAAGNRRG